MFITKKELDEIKRRLDRIEKELFSTEFFSFTKGFVNKSNIDDIRQIVGKLSQLAEMQGYKYKPESTTPAGWVRRNPKKK